MAEKTHGSTKRFGARYGRTVKGKLAKTEALAKSKYKCPYCSAVRVRKKMAGVWECKKCGKVFTGKSYTVEKSALAVKS